MSNIRVMFVGQGATGLPADRIVNVFHFVGPSDYATDAGDARDLVIDFFNGPNTTNAIGAYLSSWVGRPASVVSYDLDEPKPRVPTTQTFELVAGASLNGLPEEVAACITLHGFVPPALTGRRRGRIYIGPLNVGAITYATTEQPARPAAGFITDLTVAASRLAVAGLGLPVWSILSSKPTQNFVSIAGGYVDNAFDTQRRRGPDPTARTLWGTPPV